MHPSPSPQTRSKRIAKNTIALLLRMLVLMAINLYCVRVLLERLGVVDYGVFNAVAGVVTTLSCLTSVFSVSTQRFLSYLSGKGESEKMKEVFSASLNINVFMACLVFVAFECLALRFLNTRMSIPAETLPAANLLFHCTLLVFVCSLLQIPFTAAIISNEDMGWYTGITAMECFLKLAVALLIGTTPLNNLFFYGIGLLVVAIAVLCSYSTVALCKYTECHYTKITDQKLYLQLLSFSGWVMFGSLANVGLIQGNTILLNVFFGPIVNAAFAISIQIYNAFITLGNSVMLAVRPSMNRLYAEGNMDALLKMFHTSNKFLFAAIVCVSIPLAFNMDYILNVWLQTSDYRTILFARLIIVYILIIILNSPITIMMQSANQLRLYHLSVESVTLLSVPLTLFLFWNHAPETCVYASMIGLAVLAHCVRLYCMRRCFPDFSVHLYLTDFMTRLLLIAVSIAAIVGWINSVLDNSWSCLLLCCVASVTLSVLLFPILGLNRQERILLLKLLQSRITHEP